MIQIDGPWFKDEHGRTLILRGVNLGGSSKVPFPHGATHIRQGFFDHRNVSFVGRPFPLDEADEHFARLKAWGLTFLRFLVTWEAIEHAGPGIYDEAYLDYVEAVVRKAGEHGMTLFIDPHQDVWSRFSGGDGAPGWTFEAVGMDMTRFSDAGAAIVHAIHGDPFPRMIWPTNGDKLAAATMFTLFFGGDDFAPQTKIEGQPVQGFLQRHYIDAIKQIARRLKGLDHVVGYDTMNEPLAGFIGWADLTTRGSLLAGICPSPLEAMALGAGLPQVVPLWDLGATGFRQRDRLLVNPDGISVWQQGVEPIWQAHRVWEVDAAGQPRLLRPAYFTRVDGRPVNFANDYLRPFCERYAREIRTVDPEAIILIEGTPNAAAPHWNPDEVPNVVHAGHWYDGLTLYIKRYIPFMGVDIRTRRLVFGPRRVRRSFVAQMAAIKAESEGQMGGIPTLIGEFGIPFDVNRGRAFETGDFSVQARALDATFRALEANLLNGTLWNYTADNDNCRGDQWNGEDLSIFSRDQQTDSDDVNSGGRALEAAVRPYAQRVAGEPLSMHFDYRRRIFRFVFHHDPAVGAPTEIFIPNLQYPDGCRVRVSDGTFEIDREAQTLVYHHTAGRDEHHLVIEPVATAR
jgi:hypothetical protein